MKNRESKSVEKYFSKVKKLPLAMTFADVQSLVSAKGVTSPPKKSWWNLKNIIIMTISTILTTAILFYSLSINSTIDKNNNAENNSTNNTLKTDSQEEGKQLGASQTFEEQTNDFALNEVNPYNEDQVATEEISDIDLSMITNSRNQFLKPVGFMKFYGNYTSKSLVPLSNKKYEEPNYASKQVMSKIDGETKTVTQSIASTDLETFTLKNKFGKIKVETWNKPTIEVTAHFTLETKDLEDTKKGLDNFKMNLSTEGTNVIVNSNWASFNNCSDNSNASNGNRGLLNFQTQNSFKTEQGEKIKYKKFKIEYSVKIPQDFNVNLSNSYADIEMQTIDGVANLEVFQGNLLANNMKNLSLSVKYGNAEVNNFTIGAIEGFQSKLKLGNSEKLKLDAKYSTVRTGGVEDLNLEGFQSNFVAIEEVKNIKGSWKYGKLELHKDAENVKLTTFQTPFTAQSINHLTIEMKYGKLNAETINHLELSEGFQSNIKIENVGDIKANLKYSPLEINALKNSLDINSFNGNVDVKNIAPGFKTVNIETKYTNVNLKFDVNAKYKLEAETEYSKLTLPDGFTNAKELNVSNGNVQNFSGTVNDSGAGEASVVNLDCFNGKVVFE